MVQIEHSEKRVCRTNLLGSDIVRQTHNRNVIMMIQTVQFVRLAVLCTPANFEVNRVLIALSSEKSICYQSIIRLLRSST